MPRFLGVGGACYVFLLRQFFLGLPKELFEAAHIDGAGRLRPYAGIALPLSRPVLLLFLIARRFFVQGIATTGGKG
ncbi:ABC transporter permease subunit [Streptomyces mayteni]